MELRPREKAALSASALILAGVLMGNLQVCNLQDIYASAQNADSESTGE